MSDSNEREPLEAKHERTREQRIQAIRRWVRYIQENPPEQWGEQQNSLIDSQLQSARESGLTVDHYRRIRQEEPDH